MSYCRKGIKGRIRLYVINQSRNADLLKDVPHRKFLDLAVVYLLLSTDGKSSEVEVINCQQQKMLNMAEEELYEAAIENMEDEMRIISTGFVFDEIEGIRTVENIACATNIRGYKGAGAMLNKTVLSGFAEKFGSNVLILPSSIHEIMAVRYTGDYEFLEDMKQTVRNGNSDPSIVSPESVLSDNVYLFDRHTQEITIA